MKKHFTPTDISYLAQKGINEKLVQSQLENFKQGFPFIQISAAATLDNGIIKLMPEEEKEYIEFFERTKNDCTLLKFIPASGAASRMFKELNSTTPIQENPSALKSMQELHHFSFFTKLKEIMLKDNKDIEALLKQKEYETIVPYLLEEMGLNYLQLPKALLLFHNYKTGARTALDEQLIEGAAYARDENNDVHIQLTVSLEHRKLFEANLAERIPYYETLLKVHFIVTISFQKENTNSISLDKNGEIYRNKKGEIILRPSGHGALIENLNDCTEDIIFIKNIDNVCLSAYCNTSVNYKKVIAGYLLSVQQEIFTLLKKFDKHKIADSELFMLEGIAKRKLSMDIPTSLRSLSKKEQIAFWHKQLNRPIRVCGMVKNEGEPGGGPYWILDKNNAKSLQIIEASQIDFSNKLQQKMVQQATHFNPVDLVCGVKDYKGNKFDLKNYIDKKAGFISQKESDGEKITVQELPGLWNGAMSNWISIFIEVPEETFSPVKTLNDLLREKHLSLV